MSPGLKIPGFLPLWLQDLALKIFYFRGYLTGFRVAELMALSFTGIVDQILEALKRDKLIEVKSQTGLGDGAYQYAITGQGTVRAREALDRSQYAGPAPVPLADYNAAIRKQARSRPAVNSRVMHTCLQALTLSETTFSRIGPAVNSGTSIFLYGPPGNGKTTIARAIGDLILQEEMYIPYALDVEGHVVKLYDSVNHCFGARRRYLPARRPPARQCREAAANAIRAGSASAGRLSWWAAS